MKLTYRVVQTEDGRFKCQYRFMFFWWHDSCHPPSYDQKEQSGFATFCIKPRKPPSPSKITRVVWP